MTPYRLKHVPSGLYLDYKSREYRLNENGKVYTTGTNSLNYGFARSELHVRVPKEHRHGSLSTPGEFTYVNAKDFVKEEVKVTYEPITK